MSTVAAQAMPKVVAEAMPRAAAGATLKAAVLVRALNSEGKREPRWKQCGFFCSQKKIKQTKTMDKKKRDIKLPDLKPTKDAKGGGGFRSMGSGGPSHASGGGPSHASGGGGAHSLGGGGSHTQVSAGGP